jgi:hypothetical protein
MLATAEHMEGRLQRGDTPPGRAREDVAKEVRQLRLHAEIYDRGAYVWEAAEWVRHHEDEAAKQGSDDLGPAGREAVHAWKAACKALREAIARREPGDNFNGTD